jgi:hypothetical protein
MLRRLFTLLSALSLLLCMALVVMWVRSYRGRDHWARTARNEPGRPGTQVTSYGVESSRGLIGAGWIHSDLTPIPAETRAMKAARLRNHYDRANAVFRVCWDDWLVRVPPAGARPSLRDSVEDLGFRWHAGEMEGGTRWRWVGVPYWPLVLLTALPPAAWTTAHLRRRRTRRRRRAGLCARCSYDLRATPGRCPECGTISARNEP